MTDPEMATAVMGTTVDKYSVPVAFNTPNAPTPPVIPVVTTVPLAHTGQTASTDSLFIFPANPSTDTHEAHITRFRAPPLVPGTRAHDLWSRCARSPLTIHVREWAEALADFPDRERVEWFLHGLQHGFLLGSTLPRPADSYVNDGDEPHNNKSANTDPDVVTATIQDEYREGRYLGPFDHLPRELLDDEPFLNPLGIAAKRAAAYGAPPKKRMTCDLSQSGANATNDPRTSATTYPSFDNIITTFSSLPPAAHAFLVDIKSAFRHVPIAPCEYHKLVFFWNGQYYIDTRLCFGSSTGPTLYDQVGIFLQWIAERELGVPFLRLLDDNLGVADTKVAADVALGGFVAICARLGVPVALEKVARPARQFIFLGVEYDLDAKRARIPLVKWTRLQEELSAILRARSVTFVQLESLSGTLAWFSSIVLDGRAYIRNLYNLLAAFLHHHGRRARRMWVRYTPPVRADLVWWSTRLRDHHTSVRRFDEITTLDIVFATDASGTGFGAVWSQHFSYGQWPPGAALESDESSTTFIELCAVDLAVEMWGHLWAGAAVLCFCDNQGAVSSWRKRTSPSPRCLSVIRNLITNMHRFGIASLTLQWIPTEANVIADRLSRVQVTPSSPSRPPSLPPHHSIQAQFPGLTTFWPPSTSHLMRTTSY